MLRSLFVLVGILLIFLALPPSIMAVVGPISDSPETCTEDINQDGTVNLMDYSLFVSTFMKSPLIVPAADFNSDGFVNLFDYSRFVSSFNKVCRPVESPPDAGNYPDSGGTFLDS